MSVGAVTLVGVALHMLGIMGLGMSGHVCEHVRRGMVYTKQ